jgi:ABC-type branched-subunit amino acid transport system ATPase component
MSVLAIDTVTGGYGPMDVLHDLSMELRADEVVAILGPNGAGKSTVLKMAMGLAQVRRGAVLFAGRDITRAATHTRAALGLGYVPQVENAFLDLTVAENLRMGAYLHAGAQEAQTIDEVVALFPRLHERRNARAGALSGGERRMLAIGTTLMMRPKVLLLDEPSSDLAPAAAGFVFERIVRIRQEMRVPILLVEQNVERALGVADRAYVLVAGQVAVSARAAELTPDRLSTVFLQGAPQ